MTATQSVGCVDSRARSGWRALEESLPGFAAVIGPTCSNDVADLADAEWRARYGSRAVVISPQSSAPKLANKIDYPNVARTVGTEVHRARAFAKLCEIFDWYHVALLHDNSVWGAGGAAAIKTSVEAVNGEIITTVDFDLAAFDNGTLHVRELLARLDAASPRVIVVVTQLRVQRALYAWVFDHEILYGPGYGYFTFWPGERMLHNQDGSVNMSAVQGAKGVLGLRPSALMGAPGVVEPIVDLWRTKSSSNCAGLAYCDSDGCPASWTEYSPPTVDAVLLFAHAMDALYRTAPLSMGDPDALFAAMLQLPAFEGVTGPVQLGDDGDVLARHTLVNLQMFTGADIPCERRRQLESSISLPETRVAFFEVGEYDSLTRRLTVSIVHVVHTRAVLSGTYLAHPALPLAGIEKQYCLLARHVDCANYVGNVRESVCADRARVQQFWGFGCDDRLVGRWLWTPADHHYSLRFTPVFSSSPPETA